MVDDIIGGTDGEMDVTDKQQSDNSLQERNMLKGTAQNAREQGNHGPETSYAETSRQEDGRNVVK